MGNEVTRARSRLATLYSWGRTPDADTEAEARRGLIEAKLRKAVREALAAEPPLTTEQRQHVAALLLPFAPHVANDDHPAGVLVCSACGVPLHCEEHR